jgi:hypothetical protein
MQETSKNCFATRKYTIRWQVPQQIPMERLCPIVIKISVPASGNVIKPDSAITFVKALVMGINETWSACEIINPIPVTYGAVVTADNYIYVLRNSELMKLDF